MIKEDQKNEKSEAVVSVRVNAYTCYVGYYAILGSGLAHLERLSSSQY